MSLEESMQSPPFELIDIVVRAGAGAGKTTELTERVLKLAENFFSKHQRFPHFVVTTFTRKATQELKERLMKEAMKRGSEELVQFVKRPSQLQISTIHGVLSIYLGRFGSVMGLSPKLVIVSVQREKSQIKRKIRELSQKDESFNRNFQNLLESSEFSDVLQALCDFFRLKLQFGDVPYFNTNDFQVHLHEKSLKLFQSMKDLASEIRASDLSDAWLELASFCEAAIVKSPKEIDPTEFWQGFKDDMPAPRKSKSIPDAVVELRDQFKKDLEFFSSWRVTHEFSKAHDEFCQTFFECARVLSEELLQTKLFTGEITMQDLETLSLLLIRKHPETAEAFSKQWDYWLVDEYQDTSPAQVELLKALSGKSKSFMVGDPQQSIYLFRGARSEVFSAREDEIKETGVLFSKLINYRSRPELLEFFNFLFSGLSSQFHQMKPKAQPTEIQAVVAQIMEVVSDPNTEKELGKREESQEEKQEENDVELLAALYRCQELIQSGVAPEKICVLSRNNRDLEELAWLAQDFAIPVQMNSSGQFFERREVTDALSLLKFLCNPHDNKNLIQLLRSPVFKVSDQFLYEWCLDAGPSYWQTFLNQKNEVIKKLQDFSRQAQDSGVGQTWRSLLVSEGYFKFAHALDPSGLREANLWKLISMVRSEERRPGFSYLEFLKSLDLRALSTEEPEEADAIPVIEPRKIHLMTVHASKGLQFAHVILPKMGKTAPHPSTDLFHHCENTGKWTLSLLDPEEGKKTGSLSALHLLETTKRRQKEEEDRVLYVALTRAEESVTLIWEENPKKDSWATRLKLRSIEGTHQEEFFSYQFRKGSFVPLKFSENSSIAYEPMKEFEPGLVSQVQNFSVTELLEKKVKGPSSGAKPSMGDIQKAMTGVEVHRILESLKYKWMRSPAFQWQDLLPNLSVNQQQALEYVANDLGGTWLDVIHSGEVEFGMTVQFDDKLIQGQIDLWGQDKSGQVWVVDYKTGNPAYQDKAFKQLEIYCWALRKIHKIDLQQSVNLAVIYPFSKMTLVRQSPLHDQTEKELRSVRE